ncbi:MAG TPA: hypothetical protein VJU61_10180, partial [Polyangiaceae bacterium]|nr:hypothetical protein [Polyangiaceae bacterium]
MNSSNRLCWNRPCIAALALLALGIGACNDDDNDDTSDTPAAAGSATLAATPAPIPGARGKGNPPNPAADTRIDRAGRVAITAALVGTFNANPEDTTRERDAYNKSGLGNPVFLPTIKTSLGVLDGLDGTCGNQLLAAKTGDDRYADLAGVLLDDQLYVHSERSGSVYLGLEAEFVQAVQPGQGAAGGREPGDDVIARSYSVLAAGALSGIDDGVSEDD